MQGEVKAEPVVDEPIPNVKSKSKSKNRMEQKASRSASLKVKWMHLYTGRAATARAPARPRESPLHDLNTVHVAWF
jgi:hypothetical protein